MGGEAAHVTWSFRSTRGTWATGISPRSAPAENGLLLDPEASHVLLRQYFSNWDRVSRLLLSLEARMHCCASK